MTTETTRNNIMLHNTSMLTALATADGFTLWYLKATEDLHDELYIDYNLPIKRADIVRAVYDSGTYIACADYVVNTDEVNLTKTLVRIKCR